MKLNYKSMYRQYGVAVVTALLLTALAVTVVAGLFQQQQAHLRLVENELLHMQKKWITQSVLSFCRLAIKLNKTPGINHMGEDWAQPIKDFKIGDFMASGHREPNDVNPLLSGQIADAQSKFNLSNLSIHHVMDGQQVKLFERLLANLSLPPSLASTAAFAVSKTQPQPQLQGLTPETPSSIAMASKQGSRDLSDRAGLRLSVVEDFAVLPGFTPEVIKKLAPYVVVLPLSQGGTQHTKINLNTASPEVLAAAIEVSVPQANALKKAKLFYIHEGEFKADAEHLLQQTVDSTMLSVRSDYFLLSSRVSSERTNWMIDALIHKTGTYDPISTEVLWVRDN